MQTHAARREVVIDTVALRRLCWCCFDRLADSAKDSEYVRDRAVEEVQLKGPAIRSRLEHDVIKIRFPYHCEKVTDLLCTTECQNSDMRTHKLDVSAWCLVNDRLAHAVT